MEDKYNVTGALGQTATLVMANFGDPKPKYTWTYSDSAVPLSKHTDLGFLSILYITNLQLSDFGKYTLNMSNDFGSYVANYELIPFGKLFFLSYTDPKYECTNLKGIHTLPLPVGGGGEVAGGGGGATANLLCVAACILYTWYKPEHKETDKTDLYKFTRARTHAHARMHARTHAQYNWKERKKK